MLKKYELMVLIDSQKGEEISSIMSRVEDIVKKTEATNIKVEDLGVKDLAYPIRKQSKGHYFILRFESTGLKNKDIEKNFNMDEDIFRYIIIRDESEKILNKIKAKEEAKAVKRKEREARELKEPREKIDYKESTRKPRAPKKVEEEK